MRLVLVVLCEYGGVAGFGDPISHFQIFGRTDLFLLIQLDIVQDPLERGVRSGLIVSSIGVSHIVYKPHLRGGYLIIYWKYRLGLLSLAWFDNYSHILEKEPLNQLIDGLFCWVVTYLYEWRRGIFFYMGDFLRHSYPYLIGIGWYMLGGRD